MGDKIDPKQTRALTVGDSATAPAGMHHWSITKGRTVLAVTFNGPYTITYVRAEDAPRPATGFSPSATEARGSALVYKGQAIQVFAQFAFCPEPKAMDNT